MKIVDFLDVPVIKKRVYAEWDVFCQSRKIPLEEMEHQHIHVADLADTLEQHTFKTAFERMEDKPLDISDVDGPFFWQEEWLDKWNLEVKEALGEDYFLDWFQDGSLSILYRPTWFGVDVIDDFSGEWAWSQAISPDDRMSEDDLQKYLVEVERVLRAEYELKKEG